MVRFEPHLQVSVEYTDKTNLTGRVLSANGEGITIEKIGEGIFIPWTLIQSITPKNTHNLLAKEMARVMS